MRRGATRHIFQLPNSRVKSSEITFHFCTSFETSYNFTWGLAGSSDGPTRLWMILSFYLLFACAGQEQHRRNSNTMTDRSAFRLYPGARPSCLSVPSGAALAVPDCDWTRGESSRWEKAEDQKASERCESTVAKLQKYWLPRLPEPRERSYHSHGLHKKHKAEESAGYAVEK